MVRLDPSLSGTLFFWRFAGDCLEIGKSGYRLGRCDHFGSESACDLARQKAASGGHDAADRTALFAHLPQCFRVARWPTLATAIRAPSLRARSMEGFPQARPAVGCASRPAYARGFVRPPALPSARTCSVVIVGG